MDHRTPLKLHTILAFDGMSCHIGEVVGQGSNAIVYKAWYRDSLDRELRHHVLVKELFPYHPQKKIYRGEDDCIVIAPEAQTLWKTHKESFETGNHVHMRLLSDHPDTVMGANLNSFQYNGTLYSVLGYTGGRSLQAELTRNDAPLRDTVQRMIRLLDGLEAFHKSGYLHLDISPDNIMLVGQKDQEHIFLIDYNSAWELGSRDGRYLSCKAGYSSPEVSTGNLDAMGYTADLYSVAAVFFRCIMGRSLALAEMLQAKAPDGKGSPVLKAVPETVSAMVGSILKKGLQTLPRRRYQSIGQMRQAFQELLDRIDCVGVTHWSLWENGKRSVEELIKDNPSLRYLEDEKNLYPIRLEQAHSVSLEQYLDSILSPEGTSGMILAQGGMGKTTLLLHTAMLRGKRYTPLAPAVFYIALNGWNKGDNRYIRSQILMRLKFKRDENTFDSAMHALHKLLEQPIRTKQGNIPTALLLLDGLNEVRGDIASLVQEIHELNKLAGVRILVTSRSEIPELDLKTAKLMPLDVEDIGEALGRNGLLIPRKPDVIQLLRTPLILSLYIQACGGGVQHDIENEEQLLDAYMDSLREKETRELPQESPLRWQIDAALNYVLPAIAAEVKKRGHALTEQQLLGVVENCWNALHTQAMQKLFPQWIGHSKKIFQDAENAEQWLGLIGYQLLWQRLGTLVRDAEGRYYVFHQRVAEHLAKRRLSLPFRGTAKWITALAAVLLCGVFAVGYMQIQKDIKAALELGAAGYAEYGGLYGQLQALVDNVNEGNAEEFDRRYHDVFKALGDEAERTSYEEIEEGQVEKTSRYNDLWFTWGNPYEPALLSELLTYPDQRATFYLEILPALKGWAEEESIQQKAPDFPAVLQELLEADANLAAGIYHKSVGLHVSNGNAVWQKNINKLVADKWVWNDEVTLEILRDQYRTAEGTFNEKHGNLIGYIKNLPQNIQAELEQISEKLKQDHQIAEAEIIDEIVTRLYLKQRIKEQIEKSTIRLE